MSGAPCSGGLMAIAVAIWLNTSLIGPRLFLLQAVYTTLFQSQKFVGC